MTTITPAAKRACGDWPLLSSEEITAKLPEFTLWTVEADEGVPKLHRQVVCKNFEEALSFVNQCGAIAERYGHHPDLHLTGWNKVEVVIFTHSLKGLTDLDFQLAASIDSEVRVIFTKAYHAKFLILTASVAAPAAAPAVASASAAPFLENEVDAPADSTADAPATAPAPSTRLFTLRCAAEMDTRTAVASEGELLQ